jgi:hypothetical protein
MIPCSGYPFPVPAKELLEIIAARISGGRNREAQNRGKVARAVARRRRKRTLEAASRRRNRS